MFLQLICLPPDEKTLKTYGNGERIDIYNYKIINQWFSTSIFQKLFANRIMAMEVSFSDVGLERYLCDRLELERSF